MAADETRSTNPEIARLVVVTAGRSRESGHGEPREPFELDLERADGESVNVFVPSLLRVREIVESLNPPRIEIWCATGEDGAALLAQVRGERPIHVH